MTFLSRGRVLTSPHSEYIGVSDVASPSSASPIGCWPELLVADGYVLTDSVPLRFAWAGLGAKSLMQTALLRDHSSAASGIRHKEWLCQRVSELWKQAVQVLSAHGSPGGSGGAGQQ